MTKKLELVEKRPASLVSLSSELRTGKLSPIDYLTRFERLFDEREPRVQALVPEAQSRFERLLIERLLNIAKDLAPGLLDNCQTFSSL